MAKRIVGLQTEAWNLAGREFNLDSPKQLQEIFYDYLGLPQLRKTPKGQPSTAEPVLRELAERGYHALPAVILDYRAFTKLKTTYTDKLPLQIDQSTGRIHTSYHQATATTGRLASSDPNLQNIPIRTPEGRRVREAFCAPPGRRIVAADYSQIELRIMAHLSRDQGLLAAFAANLDVHRATAAEVFGVPLEQVTDEQRRNAKAVNFGLMYGMSAFGLSRQLGQRPQERPSHLRPILRQISGGGPIHAGHPQTSPRARLRRNPLRAPPLPARDQRQPQASPAGPPNAPPSTPPCKAPPPTSSSAPCSAWTTGLPAAPSMP